MEWVFWLSLGAVAYTYIGYPVVLHILSGIRSAVMDSLFVLDKIERRVDVSSDDEELPSLSIVISAYNEESCIGERVRNLLDQDYPTDQYRIFIGSDGSSDATNEILKSFSDSRLQVFLFESNRGKASVLNDLLAHTDSDVVAFSDANTHFEPGALRTLVRHFRDEAIGAVCGELQLHDAESATESNQDGVYWRLERILKFHEARLGGLLGANGGIYAVRRNAYQPLPIDTVIDDFMIVMRVAMGGYKVCYDPAAVAREAVSPNIRSEFQRRVRIGMGNYQAFSRLLPLLNPRYGWLTFTYISHKVLRWFVPHFAILALLVNGFLISHPFYLFTFLLQVVLYVSLGFLAWINVLEKMPAPVRMLGFLFLMNAAFLLGFFRFLRRDVKGNWASTSR